ncbi:MAG: TldD/PmbA family protein [Myxococcales bacterium]|nr:TldD/PmbA family protein [Myxococcales bacterium]MCB9707180.1 TldD/PmbA family protein [Myxococcales bacterium]
MMLGDRVTERALKAGADVAEASVHQSLHLSAKVRLKAPELVEEAGSRGVGLRVMCGQQVAVAHTSDLSDAGLDRFIEDAIELVRLTQPDRFSGPPDSALLSSMAEHQQLDLFDATIDGIDAEEGLHRAKAAEVAAFEYDPRVLNSEGSSFSRVSGGSAIVTSGGFRGFTQGTYASIVVNPVVDDTDGKKRSGYYFSSRRHLSDMECEREVGREASRRTLAKLGSRRVPTQHAPVVFDPDTARSMLSLFAGCINGSAIWRRASYLADREASVVASELVTIVDDPFIPRGPGSRAYDGEGLLSRRNIIVEGGVLKTYLLDSYSARKLNKASTASASRSASGGIGPSTSNFMLKPGDMTAEDLLASTAKGLYVTDMMGFGFNAVTGDFSRGASGFWIENGEKAHPVSEVTISLNLDQILKRIDAVANDLHMDSSIMSPTFRVSEMTIAGHAHS